jgi:hypothetical protein
MSKTAKSEGSPNTAGAWKMDSPLGIGLRNRTDFSAMDVGLETDLSNTRVDTNPAFRTNLIGRDYARMLAD